MLFFPWFFSNSFLTPPRHNLSHTVYQNHFSLCLEPYGVLHTPWPNPLVRSQKQIRGQLWQPIKCLFIVLVGHGRCSIAHPTDFLTVLSPLKGARPWIERQTIFYPHFPIHTSKYIPLFPHPQQFQMKNCPAQENRYRQSKETIVAHQPTEYGNYRI